MQMCKEHWKQLREKIEASPYGYMIANSGAEVADRMVSGKPVDFEPLMAAHNMILSNALRVGGLGLMGHKPDGSHYCPICELKADAWIDFAVRDALRIAEEAVAEMKKENNG